MMMMQFQHAVGVMMGARWLVVELMKVVPSWLSFTFAKLGGGVEVCGVLVSGESWRRRRAKGRRVKGLLTSIRP